jgi:two-component system nitrate/nitrite response regulator NarL
LFADAIRSALEDRKFEVLGVAGDGREALSMVSEESPDLALVDLGLPDQSGLVVGRMILDACPGTKIVALTALDDPRTVEEALRAGFHGYIVKDIPVPQFISQVESVLEGRLVVPRVATVRPPAAGAALLSEQLTGREREVLSLLVGGLTGQAISDRLGISANTVRTHVQSILTKLQVHSRLEAATFAVRHGIVQGNGAGRRASFTRSA